MNYTALVMPLKVNELGFDIAPEEVMNEKPSVKVRNQMFVKVSVCITFSLVVIILTDAFLFLLISGFSP